MDIREIDEATGYGLGDRFKDGDEIREYFTADNLFEMGFEFVPTHLSLEMIIETVIREGYHVERLEGEDALAYALHTGESIEKYSDPIEGARTVTPREALEISREDVNLLYVDFT